MGAWFKLRPFGLGWLLVGLMAVNALVWFGLPRLRFQSVVIHHTASTVDNYESIKRFQYKKHGWLDAAYHLILSNGSTRVPAGHLEPTNRYRWLAWSLGTRSAFHNLTGVHLCVVGNFEASSFPSRLRAPLAHAVRLLQDKYGLARDRILFHKDCSGTKCPGRNLKKAQVRKWAESLADSCPGEIKAQQRKIVAQSISSIHTLPSWALAGMAGASLVVLTLWSIVRSRTRPENDQPATPEASQQGNDEPKEDEESRGDSP